jgi:hypothetical protein
VDCGVLRVNGRNRGAVKNTIQFSSNEPLVTRFFIS